MKSSFVSLALGSALTLAASASAAAALLTAHPSSTTITVGGTVTVDLEISGVVSPGGVAGFTIDLAYDGALLALTDVTHGTELGASLIDDDPAANPLFLSEVSLETDPSFFASQPESFWLVRLTFAGLAPGTSPLTFGPRTSLADADGNSLSFTTADGAVQVQNPPPTAARLAYFNAAAVGTGPVNLTWATLVEVGILGFHVERATASGGWERITPQLIPATGWDPRPQTYALADAASTGTTGTRYRLLEVNLRGEASVLAQASVSAAPSAAVERTARGWRLNLHGTPHRTVRVESASQVAGPWALWRTVELDAEGAGSATIGTQGAETARFYRW